jgi:hypothetical protein
VTDARSSRAFYKRRRERARALLAMLAALLDQHALAHVREPENWERMADLSRLNHWLSEAVLLLGGNPEQGGS